MRSMVEEMVDEMLDMDGEVKVAGYNFLPSAIIKEMDPIAYGMLLSDVADNLIADLQYELDCLDDDADADEVEDLKYRIEQLERI